MSDFKINRLDDVDVDGVSGGSLFYAKNVTGSDPNNPWEVINNTDKVIAGKNRGDVLGRYDNPGEAANAAQGFGVSTDAIDWDTLQALRS